MSIITCACTAGSLRISAALIAPAVVMQVSYARDEVTSYSMQVEGFLISS